MDIEAEPYQTDHCAICLNELETETKNQKEGKQKFHDECQV